MKKKGVSPLIATVLIIAFTIILFALISVWVRRTALEPGMQAGEEKVANTLECSNINIAIVSACVYSSNTGLKLKVDNIGNSYVTGIKVRAIGATGVDIDEVKDPGLNFAALARITQTFPIAVGAISKVEVYPMISTGVCEGRFVSISTIEDVGASAVTSCS